MNTSNNQSSAKTQWIGLGVIAVALVAIVAVVVVKHGDNGPTAEEKRTQICALRDSSNEPLVDPNASTSRADLAASVRQRANALIAAADGVDGATAEALRSSADAMNKVADAIAADTSGKSLADTIAQLASDSDLQKSGEILQKVLTDQCS